MTTRRIPSASLFLILPILVLAFATGCMNTGSASPQVDFLDDGEGADSGNRTDCGAIFGTAFRSTEERDWFQSNCSRWPLVNVPASNSASNASLPRECNDMRGRPYQSDEQRRWYLENCLGGNDSNNATSADAPQPGDRTNCDEIRGTPYRSNTERAWYATNCGANQQQVSAGPDRTNCDEIRGTPYRSNAERDWFQRSCAGQTATNSNQPGGGSGRPVVVVTVTVPGRSGRD